MESNLVDTTPTSREFTLDFLRHITNNLSEDRIIGKGGFAVVYKGVLDNGEEIALKKLTHIGPEDTKFADEFNNIIRAHHQNIIQYVGYCYHPGNWMKLDEKYIFAHEPIRILCFEYLHGGDLERHLSDEQPCGLDWQTCYKIIKGVCSGLNYLHSVNIYHLDLKPANILLDNNMMPKIGDFGISRIFPSAKTITTATGTLIGTMGFMPPEYINENIISQKYDVFSLGAVILQIMAGRQSYRDCGRDPSETFIELVCEKWRKKLHPTMSPHSCQQVNACIGIALRCLEDDRQKRPTTREIATELNRIDMGNLSLTEEVVNELNLIDTEFCSLTDKATNLQSRVALAYNHYKNSGVSDLRGDWRGRFHLRRAAHPQHHHQPRSQGDQGEQGGGDPYAKLLALGQSEVIEVNHILILGWSNKLGSLLKQLAIANKSIGGGVVVVLAERNKEEMEMDIGKLGFDFMGTSVICRSGSPLILADLKKVSVSEARVIIVLAPDENADQSDARALRLVLSLTGVKEGLRGHIVVEMSDLDNEPLVKLVGGELIETVVSHDVIGRLMIQCALQPGLAQIWEDILGFENAEFCIKRWPKLDGMRFGDVLISFPNAVPCGVKLASAFGSILMNPDDDYVLREGDEILVIAEDDDTYAPAPLPELHKGFLPNVPTPPKYPEKILFCGWRRDIHHMIMVLEAFLAPGSELWMFNEVPEKAREAKLTDSDESVEDSIVQSDSRSIATLLLIRDIQSRRLPSSKESKSPLHHNSFSHSSWIRKMQRASDRSIIISEILDSRTRNLVSVSKISDYVLSNELVSMALAMVAEDKQINRVLQELFAEEGNEMCIRSAEFYLYEQEELSFLDIMVRARERDEIVIGYRLANTDEAIINPEHKSEIKKWSLDDMFVVIAKGD
ncbi:probable ion channel POLLUX isoform X2 [Triticum dicoccoides]|uniref:probable ion channel POLLUX isoform X2 n=1 Tax=Triticum dicoccoides TaxID=85692 RepID=UPI00188EA445|nr:probable ion channel POLLUX isoform X2 [Triticum dicoccoides]